MKCPIPLVEDLILAGSKNRPGGNITPRYITIHDTGNPSPGANAKAHASYLKGDNAAGIPVSWHFTVDDRGAYQHLPVNEHGWHAGDGRGLGNMESIGVEICENGNRAKAEENAAALVAWMLVTLGLDTDRVVPHKHWTATSCPHLLSPRWDDWIAGVRTFKALYESSQWDPVSEIAKLRERDLVNSDHDPSTPVTWGQFATVLNRLLSHVE